MHLKEHLDRLADELSVRPLPAFADRQELEAWQHDRREALFEQWGLAPLRDQLGSTPAYGVTGTLDAGDHRIERLWLRTLDQLVVTANLYVPHGLTAPAPAILYLCGHSPRQKFHYQEHARRFAQLGFVTLIVDTVQHGEIPGTHKGTHSEGAFHWFSRGYSPAAVEAWNAMRGIDLLCARPDVDPDRIGATGHSGGGAVSWWVAATDPRVRAIASSSGTATEASHLRSHTLDGHCDCYFPSWRDGTAIHETYALVAPRPVLVVAPRLDLIFHPDAPYDSVEQLRPLYREFGRPEDVDVFSFDAGHRYTKASRQAVFAWMLTHVAGTPTRPDQVEDLDGVIHPDDDLRVFVDGAMLPQNENATLPDWFLPGRPPVGDLEQVRERLRSTCFALALSTPAEPPRIKRWYEDAEATPVLTAEFTYVSEPGVRQRAMLTRPQDGTGRESVTVDLRSPDDYGQPWWPDFTNAHPVTGSRALVDVRGVGDTGWGPGQTLHLRRAAALVGRTIAGLRIWDTLCALDAIEQLTSGTEIILRAEGDLAVVALFAAVLDPRIARVELADLPATLDAPSDPSGREDLIEVLHALRIADIPDLLELVEATFLDPAPQSRV